MASEVLAYKWFILLGLEVLAWSATIWMVYARYRQRSQRLFRVAALMVMVTGVVPQLGLGVLNYIESGQVDAFSLVILLLFGYGATLGRRQVQRLDGWARQRWGAAGEKNL